MIFQVSAPSLGTCLHPRPGWGWPSSRIPPPSCPEGTASAAHARPWGELSLTRGRTQPCFSKALTEIALGSPLRPRRRGVWPCELSLRPGGARPSPLVLEAGAHVEVLGWPGSVLSQNRVRLLHAASEMGAPRPPGSSHLHTRKYGGRRQTSF